LKRFTAFFAPIFKNLWQTTPPDCCREQTGKTKKFPLRLPKRPLFTVVVVNSGQNTPPQSLYWWSKPVYPQTRAAEESGSFLEQDSTTVPKFAYPLILPLRESCWGVPSPNPALRLAPLIPPLSCGNRKEVIPCERNTTRSTAAMW